MLAFILFSVKFRMSALTDVKVKMIKLIIRPENTLRNDRSDAVH